MLSIRNRKEKFPKPTPINKIKAPKNGFVNLVKADLLFYKRKCSNKVINKTITLPEWLNDLAIDRNINFSKTLKDALLVKLRLNE